MSAIVTRGGHASREATATRNKGLRETDNDRGRMTGIGLAIQASSADDHFIAALVDSLAEPVVAHQMGLFTRVVDGAEAEIALYTRWARTNGIAGVVLIGSQPEDERISLVRSLGMPFAAVVDVNDGGDFPAVAIDVTASLQVVGAFLAEREHERVVYISSPTTSVSSPSRSRVFGERFAVMHSKRAPASAVDAATRAIADGPATLLFDSDVHAAAAVSAFAERGLRVPEDVAVVSWTDSALCRSASPSITAVDRRGGEIGRMLGSRVLAAIAGEPVAAELAPLPFIVRRESA